MLSMTRKVPFDIGLKGRLKLSIFRIVSLLISSNQGWKLWVIRIFPQLTASDQFLVFWNFLAFVLTKMSLAGRS